MQTLSSNLNQECYGHVNNSVYLRFGPCTYVLDVKWRQRFIFVRFQKARDCMLFGAAAWHKYIGFWTMDWLWTGPWTKIRTGFWTEIWTNREPHREYKKFYIQSRAELHMLKLSEVWADHPLSGKNQK